MREKIRLFRESLKLVWQSAPGWATANTILSVIRSVLPLLLLWLLKNVIDAITSASSGTGGSPFSIIVWPVASLILIWFLDEALSDISNYVRKKQSLKFEAHMYSLLHSKASRLDLINFENPGYFDSLSRATREAPWRPNNILNNLVSILRASLSLLIMAGLILSLHWSLAHTASYCKYSGNMAQATLCRCALQLSAAADSGSQKIRIFQLAANR